jgi:hypothetical protein
MRFLQGTSLTHQSISVFLRIEKPVAGALIRIFSSHFTPVSAIARDLSGNTAALPKHLFKRLILEANDLTIVIADA